MLSIMKKDNPKLFFKIFKTKQKSFELSFECRLL